METGTVKLRKALTNMSRMVMPALLICRNIFGMSGPRIHLDAQCASVVSRRFAVEGL